MVTSRVTGLNVIGNASNGVTGWFGLSTCVCVRVNMRACAWKLQTYMLPRYWRYVCRLDPLPDLLPPVTFLEPFPHDI